MIEDRVAVVIILVAFLVGLVTALVVNRVKPKEQSMRPSWNEMFLEMAQLVAERSTCPRLSCGAVIVSSEYQVLTTGYNGAPRGEDHCTDVGCLEEGGHCVRALHAELNAILQGARLGTSLHGATLYATHRPCVRCAASIIQAGISRVVYLHDYDSDGLFDKVRSRLWHAGIAVQKWEGRK